MRVMLASARHSDEAELRAAVGQAADGLQDEVDRLRDIIHDVRPSSLDDLGLMAAMEALVARHAYGGGPALRLEVDLDHEAGRAPERLHPEVETAIYRIAQEALTNALKHAEARTVEITVAEIEAEVGVRVRDDGRGYDTQARTTGFGLGGMQERAELLGGRLRISRRRARGPRSRRACRRATSSRAGRLPPAEARGQVRTDRATIADTERRLGGQAPCMARPNLVGVDGRAPPRRPADCAGFGRIICAVGPARFAQAALDQARMLAGPEDTLTSVAVADVREAARDAGLLVIGADDWLHPDGVPLGRLPSRHDPGSPVAVLTARGRPELGFPGVVLVGTQGSEDQHAVMVAATIAARHDTRVVLAHVGRPDSALQLTLAEQAADVLAITGRDPPVVTVAGLPIDRLTAMASSIGAGLLVLGSRCPQTLAGVSASVACRASCSVLVLPAENYAPFQNVHSSIDVPDPDARRPPNEWDGGVESAPTLGAAHGDQGSSSEALHEVRRHRRQRHPHRVRTRIPLHRGQRPF